MKRTSEWVICYAKRSLWRLIWHLISGRSRASCFGGTETWGSILGSSTQWRAADNRRLLFRLRSHDVRMVQSMRRTWYDSRGQTSKKYRNACSMLLIKVMAGSKELDSVFIKCFSFPPGSKIRRGGLKSSSRYQWSEIDSLHAKSGAIVFFAPLQYIPKVSAPTYYTISLCRQTPNYTISLGAVRRN